MERSHAGFALALHRELARDQPPGQNLPWSPYSVASALGLVAAGARGRTRDELAAVLGGDLPALGRMLAGAAAPPEAEAAVANSLWLDRHLGFREEYQATVLGWPGGAVHTTAFRDDPDGSRRKINDDVALTTRGLVKDLLAAGTVTPATAAVIVNALYLKVAWQQPFPAAATAPAQFHTPSGAREVPAMRQRERIRYAAGGGWRMVTLPTRSEVVVDVLLPDDGGGDTTPAPATLLELRDAARMAQVDLVLPRFRVEAATVLNRYLRRRGVVAAFTRGGADFSGITDAEMFVDTVVHKAVLRVDEQGFEGAAATALVMRAVSMNLGGRPVRFHVDRPFLLVVRHSRTGATYFLAWVADPVR